MIPPVDALIWQHKEGFNTFARERTACGSFKEATSGLFSWQINHLLYVVCHAICVDDRIGGDVVRLFQRGPSCQLLLFLS